MPSRSKGFSSFDALLSIIPLVLLIVLLLHLSAVYSRAAGEKVHRQIVFDKLVSIADYTVRSGIARKENGIRYPNWVEPDRLGFQYAERLRIRSGLARLYIGCEKPPDRYSVCISRLVVVGEDKEMKRLFACGD
ncbi:hypothetical protein GF318_01435 [Candidatus Micrarchaeota archaeon]|nr:hypothetical protein [Candidatus Micrarchaeota archaeon]